jgi:RNA polymerase sigma-70 factor (ECF subfamily)
MAPFPLAAGRSARLVYSHARFLDKYPQDSVMSATVMGWLFGGAFFDSGASSPTNHSTDEASRALVSQIRAGDESAFQSLWMQYCPQLISFAARYLESTDVAADVVQDVFVTLWFDREKLAPRTTLAAYLYRAVWHRAQNVRRSRGRERSYAALEAIAPIARLPMGENAGEKAVEVDDARTLIARLLNRMTPRVREIFLLSRGEGLTAPEIADALGISPQVVRNKLAIATKILAENIKGL